MPQFNGSSFVAVLVVILLLLAIGWFLGIKVTVG